jgi:DNA-binding transcriptional ArsR family regulator
MMRAINAKTARQKRPKRSTPTAPVEALEPRARDAAHLLKLLASEQRLTILCRLSDGEKSVGELGQYVNLSQGALSQHLAKLRAEKIVATRRDAQTIYYRLADEAAVKLIGFLCDLYGPH